MASRERAFPVTNGVISYGAELSAYGYRYDECNNLTKLTCSVLGSTWSTVYTYDADNRASTTTLASGKVIENTFDPLGRVQKRAIKQGNTTIHETTIGYLDVSSSKTTALVSTYQNGSDAAYAYEYDAVGNIVSITQGNTSISYVYDAANRLIREDNGVTNQTIVYDYTDDLWGNIQNKKIYAYTTGTLPATPASTVSYVYANTDWGDQLTEYDEQTITYDSMGNPTSYRGYTFGWRGKQLTSASNGTNSLTFEYNEDGLRQKKTVNNIDTNYFYNGSVLIGMQRGTSTFLFSYDASGNVVSVNYNGTEYYYLRNAQGDIVKLIDASGATVVEYTYDTWGKKVSTTGTLAGTLGLFQPFRYRGYVYDWETGFYYLQSRYYDPMTGRFISADVLLSTGQGVLGCNAYAYCNDNPVVLKDEGGNIPSYSVDEADSGENGVFIDEKNKVIKYNVPLFNQDTTPLCWAYCQIMVYAYRYNRNLSQNEADSIAKMMDAAVQFVKPQNQKGNHGSYPHDIIDGINVKEITCIDLYELLKDHGPLYAFYQSERGHYVVITGVDVVNNIVYTNNPWSYSGEQPLEDFMIGVLSIGGNTEPIGKLSRITWSR